MNYANNIKIGITGDYPPLTAFDENTGEYQGFDIDMAHNLGKFLHKKIIFVKTTWPSLGEDLQAHQFDIAMGGIAITKERAQQFIFSKPVLVDEKVAVFNCENQSKYQSLSDIDQPHVKVIENPGGTNERFARQQLPKADIRIFADNTTIFSQLLNHQADVMITDAIEAGYQQKLHPELCVLHFPHETEQERKAYMLRPEDQQLLAEVNAWINQIEANRVLDEIKSKWLWLSS
ncbi:MAG TPA: transporter substrate-binding domain-containing protein [Gammaproteobacteria bacterium]|nr:transporter substrate-binding domain-containing protein [Gammaproteobacteria bacterium]